MNQNILLSKIVPNSTDTTWAQAYTTLNVYITLSIEKSDSKTPVTTHGKDLLEKLQREFFALDEKTLENIKNAVGNVSSTIEKDYSYSILVGAIARDILYIVIASTGQVVIKRGSKVGVIATGVENELHGFSGKLEHDDIIILETGDFDKKLPLPELSDHLSSNDVLQIAENITPIIHGESKGTEGAIILQFKNLTSIPQSEQHDFEIGEEKTERPERVEGHEYAHENLWTKEPKENNNIEELNEDTPQYEDYADKKPSRHFSLPKLPLPNFTSKKIIITGIIILLVALLVGGITLQSMKANEAKKAAAFSIIYNPVKEKFDGGIDLEPMNKSLALEDFLAASTLAKDALSKYKAGSSEYNKIKDIQSQIDKKVAEIGGGGSAKNLKELLKATGDIKSITALTAKGGTLLILDKSGEQVATISEKGSVAKTYDIKSGDLFMSADDKYIYTMGNGVTSIDRGNGKVTKIIKSIKGDGFDIFGSNVYTLNGNDILKYKAPSYESASYFTDKPSFRSNPIGMSISGPIYVIEADGTIERFTKGKKDDFSVTGLPAQFSQGAMLYVDPENNNVYVMDVKNQRVVVLNNKGEYQTQYEGSFIKDATSFAIDEKNKIGYVLKSNTVYSFDL